MKYILPVLSISLLALTGCQMSENTASMSSESRPYADVDINEPDFIAVERFSVTPVEAMALMKLTSTSSFGSLSQTDREIAIGRAFADSLQEQLVSELKEREIKAYPLQSAPPVTFKTGIIRGFFKEDQAGGTQLGFGLTDSDISMRLIFFMESVVLGETTVTAETDLKAGRQPNDTTLSQGTLNDVDAGAKLVSVKVADEILASYKRRGWRK